MTRDWVRWHERYYDVEDSDGRQRLATVQRHIRGFLDTQPPGPIRIVDACAGQGRDLVPVLASHRRGADCRARLIELDPRNAAAARDAVGRERLRGVEVVEADAGVTEAYAGAVPADLVLLCGVFGHLSDADIRATVAGLPGLCAAAATVIWTRSRGGGDLTPAIRGWFDEAGFAEQAFDSPGTDGSAWSVGVHRLERSPDALEPRRRLFSFLD